MVLNLLWLTPAIAAKFLEAVEDFAKLNNKNMFKGLKFEDISEEDETTLSTVDFDDNNDYFKIYFSPKYNMAQIKEYTENI